MAREITSSDAAMKICGLFYRIYRVVPSSVHGRCLRVYCENLPKRQLVKNPKELSDVIEYKIVVNKRRLTAEEAERYFSSRQDISQEAVGRETVASGSSIVSGT